MKEYGKLTVLLLALICVTLTVGILLHDLKKKELEITFFDIGQGDAIFIQTPGGHDMLIDGGPDLKVIEKLAGRMSYFDKNLDVVVATHPDADHVTGLVSVLDRYEVGHIITSPVRSDTGVFDELQNRIDDEGATLHTGRKNDQITFGDGVTVKILYPGEIASRSTDTNDASVTVLVTYGSTTALLTGDLSLTLEGELIDANLPRDITIYKAGHHGSNTSSGSTLLSYVRPEYSVISAGKENRYGHPHKETLERLSMYSKRVVSTIDRGDITFSIDGIKVNLVTEK